MLPRIMSVCPKAEYVLELAFTNGEVGHYDCTPHLDFGVFRKLGDPAYFRRVRATMGTVAWPDGQDICPDTLYLGSVKSPPPPEIR